jgi:hypothetical protein
VQAKVMQILPSMPELIPEEQAVELLVFVTFNRAAG